MTVSLPLRHVLIGAVAVLLASWCYLLYSTPGGVGQLHEVASPTLKMVSRAGTVILLLALTPLAKSLACRFLDTTCSCGGGAGTVGMGDHSISCYRLVSTPVGRSRRARARAVTQSLLWFAMDWAVPILFVGSLLGNSRLTHVAIWLWGSKGGVFGLWVYEVVARRHAAASNRYTLVILACLWLYLGKVMSVDLEATTFSVFRATFLAVRAVVVASLPTGGAVDGSDLASAATGAAAQGGVYWPAAVAGATTVAIALVGIDLAIAAHVRRNHPAQLRHTTSAYSRVWLWVPTTFIHIILWYLLRPATLTSIFICYEQYVRFRQIRTIVPTVGFAAVEIGQVFWQQWIAFRHQTLRNHQVKHVSNADTRNSGIVPRSTSHFRNVRRRELKLGQHILILPGGSAPGTVLLEGVVPVPATDKSTDAGGDAAAAALLAQDAVVAPCEPGQTVLINTVAVDGESAGKERVTCPAGELAATEAGLGMADAGGSDDHLSRHPCVIRQGAKVASTHTHAVVGKLVGFNAPAMVPKPPTLLDTFIQRVGRLGVAMLALYTALSLTVASQVYGIPPSWDTFVELFLVNNVCLPMTLATVLGVVLQCIAYGDHAVPGLPMQAKRAVVSFVERAAKAGRSNAARRAALDAVLCRRPAPTTARRRLRGALANPPSAAGAAAAGAARAHAHAHAHAHAEAQDAAGGAVGRIRGVHLTDKTGTLTQNHMRLGGSISLAPVATGGSAAGSAAGEGDDEGLAPGLRLRVADMGGTGGAASEGRGLGGATAPSHSPSDAAATAAAAGRGVPAATPGAGAGSMPSPLSPDIRLSTPARAFDFVPLAPTHSTATTASASAAAVDRNDWLALLATAVTSNTVQAPNLEPEEQAYSKGLGVELLAVVSEGASGWQSIRYRRHGRETCLRRLHLGFSRRHKCVSALLWEAADEAGGGGDSAATATGSATAAAPGRGGTVRLVMQGSPEAALGETGLAMTRVLMPTLEQAAERWQQATGSPPDGAQRNWVISVSEPFHMPRSLASTGGGNGTGGRRSLAWLEQVVQVLRDGGVGAGAGALLPGANVAGMGPRQRVAAVTHLRDEWLAGVGLRPYRYMLLVDTWRDGVMGVPEAIAGRGLAFWMVTGDGLANARSIADAIGMRGEPVVLRARATAKSVGAGAAAASTAGAAAGDAGADADAAAGSVTVETSDPAWVSPEAAAVHLANDILTATQNSPRLLTIYADVSAQRVMATFPTLLPTDLAERVGDALAAADASGRPLVQLVAYASETELKGRMVQVARRTLNVATTFTGDGKNDIRGMEQADVSFAFPCEVAGASRQADQGAIGAQDHQAAAAAVATGAAVATHDPEVAAAASAVVNASFWRTWAAGHSTSLASWGAVLWTRVYITTVLLLLKQGLTAGINVAAAAATNMLENRDPYRPVWYQAFNVGAFAAIIVVGIIAPVRPRLGTPLLATRTAALTSVLGYALGLVCFAAASHAVAAWGVAADAVVLEGATLGLGFAFVALLGAALYQVASRQRA